MTDLERADRARPAGHFGSSVERQRDAHLVEVARGLQPGGRQLGVVVGARAEHPEHEPAAAARRDVADGGGDERATRSPSTPRVGREREAQRPVAAASRCRCGRRARRPASPTRKPAESGRGCSRSSHTASPSAGWPSTARASSSMRATAPRPRRSAPAPPRQRTVRPRDEGTVAAVARPRGAKARAAAAVELLRELYPDVQLRARSHERVRIARRRRSCRRSPPTMRVNMVTPTLFAKYPTPADLASADPAEVESIIQSTGFFHSKAKNLIGMAQARGRALRRRDPGRARRSRHAAGSRAQDGQRRALGVVPRARPAGRHARHPAVGASEADRRDRPGEDRARSRRDRRRPRSGATSRCA